MTINPPVQKKMSYADAAWLQMEHPTNLMMITGLFIFKRPVDFKRLYATIECRLLRYPRFRRYVVTKPVGRPCWHLDPEFDLKHHLEEYTLPDPGDKATLFALVSELMSKPLPRNKPLWHLLLLQNLEGGSALIARLHHAIADGMALMKLLINLTDEEPDAPWPEPMGEVFSQESFPSTSTSLQPTSRTVKLFQSRDLLIKPKDLIDFTKAATDLGKTLLLEKNIITPFSGELGVKKQASVSAPIELNKIKKIGHRIDATINDVLLAALTGSLHRYLLHKNYPLLKEHALRVVVPVDLREPGDYRLGNRFGLVFMDLPVGLSTPRERLEEVKRRMDALKSSGAPQAIVVFGLLQAVGPLPADLEKKLIEFFGSNATAVVTNVPGPKVPLYLAGSRIDSMMFWVPQAGRLGLGVSILSYAGHVRVGLANDAQLITEPGFLLQAFQEELAALWRSEVLGRDLPSDKLEVREALDRFYRSYLKLKQGQPEAMQPLWLHSEQAFLLDTDGKHYHGWTEIKAHFDQICTRNTPVRLETEHVDIELKGDWALAVAVERHDHSSIRSTNIFVKQNNDWLLCLRHCDPLA